MVIGHDLVAREAYILDLVRLDGEVSYDPIRPDEPEPEVAVRVKAPGGMAGHHGSFKYSETYRRAPSGFEIVEYAYGYWSQRGLGSLEYHWHPLAWSEGGSILHAHCAPATGDRGHFRAHAMLVAEARERFRLLSASERSVDCHGLYPMGVQ